jgi:uncharacterized protein YjeT (DUF2065 family)
MDSFTLYILTAFALVLVIEGLIYGLFPDAVKRMMTVAITTPKSKLRNFGLCMAALGFVCVWLIGRLNG